MTRRLILLTNDDGVHAEGLRVARAILQPFGEVVTIAPDREMSGASHALTINHPLRVTPVGPQTFVVNGTPTDCVNLAINRVLEEKPALVFSGINRGSNIGYDLTYSGTVSAAFEGRLHGVTAVAASIVAAGDLEHPRVAKTVAEVVARVLDSGPEPMLLNLNMPAGEFHGVRLTVQGDGGYRTEVIEKKDPRGNSYYWIGGAHAHDREQRPQSDIGALREGYVSITPLGIDLTDHERFAALRDACWPAAGR
jgi:5'-nucleotidase